MRLAVDYFNGGSVQFEAKRDETALTAIANKLNPWMGVFGSQISTAPMVPVLAQY